MTECINVNFGEWQQSWKRPPVVALEAVQTPCVKLPCCRKVFVFCLFLCLTGRAGLQYSTTRFWDFNWNGGWHVSLTVSNVAGRHCSHGCSLSTQADSPVSRPVSRPATHSSWVGEWEKPDPPDTGCIMFGQSSDTTGHGAQYATFKSRVCSYSFRTNPLVFALLSEMAVAMCCSLTLPSLTTVV